MLCQHLYMVMPPHSGDAYLQSALRLMRAHRRRWRISLPQKLRLAGDECTLSIISPDANGI